MNARSSLLILWLVSLLIVGSGKDVSAKVPILFTNDTIYYFTDKNACFPGGEEAMSQFIAKNLQYPQQAREIGKEARIFVRFVAMANGSIERFVVLNPTNTELDNEALRLVRLMPRWQPAMRNGIAVNVYVTVPISFKLR